MDDAEPESQLRHEPPKMIKKILIYVFFVTLVFYIFFLHYQSLDNLQDNLNDLESRVSSLESEKEDLESRIDELEYRLTNR